MDNPTKESPVKKADLQGIRGLAIIAVIGFHFYPNLFPNGYLGVDQFFVLSGFLMCMLLKRAEKEPPCTLISIFYSKRFKRILPVYLLVIFCSMLSLYAFFPDIVFETNEESAMRALFFLSNTPKTGAQNYFMMLTKAMDIFTHTWSLSVEIQFYFLIPFIFLIGKKFPSKIECGFYALLGLVSLAFFLSSPESVAFFNVLARIWQFSVGIIAYFSEYAKSQKEMKYLEVANDIESCESLSSDEKSLLIDETFAIQEKQDVESQSCTLSIFPDTTRVISYTILFVLVVIAVFPTPLDAHILRPLTTICLGGLILTSKNNAILSNRVFTYIGDISYSLYLIHWPIYSYWKLTYGNNKSLLAVALISSIFLAVLTFETFEKWCHGLSFTKFVLVVVLLFVFNVILVKHDQFPNYKHIYSLSMDNITSNMTIDDAIRLNNNWNKFDIKNLNVPYCSYETEGPLAWCSHKGLNATSKYKFVIIGNSWAANHGSLFNQECGYKANTIIQGSFPECEMIYPTKNLEVCNASYTNFRHRIEMEKPDYLFIITRYISIGDPMPANVTTFSDDPIYQLMKKQLLEFLSNTKFKVFILNALPAHNLNQTKNIGPWIKEGVKPLEVEKRLGDEVGIPFEHVTLEMARKRYAELVKECNGRCVLVDYKPEFFNKATNTYRLFDERGFEYFTTGLHLSPHGLERIRHVWTDVCAKL